MDNSPKNGDDKVIKKKIIPVLFAVLLLLTSCSTTKQQNIVRDEKPNLENYEDAEKYYLDLLTKNPNPDIYIKLADLYRDNYQYGKEGAILAKGINELDNPVELQLRFAQYQTFTGDGNKAQASLLHILDEEFDENIFKEIIKICLEIGYDFDTPSYYEKFKEEITDLESKILVYKILSSEEELKTELENELLNSNNLEAYEAIMGEAFVYRDYDKIEKLLPNLETIDGGLEYYNIYSQLLAMKDLDIINKQIGNFVNMDYKDMVVMYRDIDDHLDIHVALIDGKTGEIIIDKIMEDFHPDFVDLSIYEKEDELDWLAVTSFYGMSATSGKKFSFLKFDKDSFEMFEPTFETDLEIELLEGFKVQIESKKIGKKYIIDIPKSYRLAYIEDGQFNNQGIPSSNSQTRIYNDGYSLKYRGNYKDTISILTGFGGTHSYSADRLGFIQEIYNKIDGKFKCTGIFIKDIEGLARKSEFIDGSHIITLSEPEETKEKDEATENNYPDYPKYLIEEDFKLIIGDKTITVNDSIDYIIKQLGPSEIKLVQTVNENANIYEYEKNGISIIYIETTASGETHKYNDTILVTQPGIKTIRGLEVGIDKSQLEKLYGLGTLFHEDENEAIYMYHEGEDNTFMNLFVVIDKKENKVTRFNFATNL